MKEVKAEVDQVAQAPEIPFEEVESMVDEALALPEVESMVEVESLVDEALALPPPREFHIQVRTFWKFQKCKLEFSQEGESSRWVNVAEAGKNIKVFKNIWGRSGNRNKFETILGL